MHRGELICDVRSLEEWENGEYPRVGGSNGE